MNQFRKKIRSTPLLYKVFLYFKNGYKYKLPNSGTDLHLTGFQRSGNTYTGNYIKLLYPKKKIVTHFHTISSLKSAKKSHIPIVVLFRNPEGSILSSIVKRMEGMDLSFKKAVKYDLSDYISYYSYVLENKDKINLIHFDDAINNEELVIKKISTLLGVPFPNEETINHVLNEIRTRMIKDKRVNGDRNMPSKYKEDKKNAIKFKVENNAQYLQCVEIYSKLKECYNNKV